MTIAAITIAVVLVVAGVVLAAWLLLRDGDRDGASDPVAAVDSFLQAVYHDLDPAAADSQVCSEARDRAAMAAKIDSIREYRGAHAGPAVFWSDLAVIDQTGQLVVVSVTITMVTADERTAEQTLHIGVLDKGPRGWWVCNVDSVPAVPGGDGNHEEADQGDGNQGDGEGEAGQ